MMKKIMTVLVLVMFMLSGSIAAYAQDQARDEKLDRGDKVDKRFDRSDKAKELRAKGLDRRKDYREHTDAYKKECSDKPSDAAGCVQARADISGSLDKVVDRLLQLTRKVHARLSESELIDRNELIKLTDVYQAKLLVFKRDLAGDVRPDKLKATQRELRETWKMYRLDLEHVKDSLFKEKIYGLLVRAEKISLNLQRASDRLKTDNTVDSAKVARIDEALIMIEEAVADVKEALKADLSPDRRPKLQQAIHDLHGTLQKIVMIFGEVGHRDAADVAVSDAVSDEA